MPMHTCQAPPACPRSAASAKLTLLPRWLCHGRAADVRHLQSSTMWSICSPWAWQTWLARADARRQVATKHRDAVCYMRAVDIRRTARAPCKPRRFRHCVCVHASCVGRVRSQTRTRASPPVHACARAVPHHSRRVHASRSIAPASTHQFYAKAQARASCRGLHARVCATEVAVHACAHT